jgi:Domain of unknown function (DUF4336)
MTPRKHADAAGAPGGPLTRSARRNVGLRQLHSDLWVADAPLRFVGLEVGARMTVVRLPGGDLVVHSPIAATEALVDEVKALGRVAYLVAPNRFHHLFVGDWLRACPAASVWVAPGLDQKRPDLKIAGVLTAEPEPGWAGTIDQVVLGGFPLLNEVVFFHRHSATLIATDLAFNVGSSSPPLTRLVFRLLQAYGRVSPSLLERLFVRDRAVFRRSLERIVEWPFERVVVAHGQVSETGGREELVRGYSWVLEE